MITALAVICFFTSCGDNLKEVQKMELSSNEPVGEAEAMLLKHTDSGRLKMTLTGEKMLDFSNDEFPYTHFPEGIFVEIFNGNDSLQKTTIKANEALIYDSTDIMDLRGDVVIVDSDENVIRTNQMFFNQRDKWIFTNDKFKTYLKNKNTGEEFGQTSGSGFDADQKMQNVSVRQPDDTFINNKSNE